MADRPKRPLSGYMIWLGDHREQIKSENPGIKVTEVAKRGGEMWRALKDKSIWEQKAAEAKERYSRQLREFEANGGSMKDLGGGKKRGKVVAKKAPVKKSKKPAQDSDDDDSAEDDSD